MSELHAAMALAFTEMEAATKSAVNGHLKSKYADLGSVIDAIKPALAKHDLFFWQVSHDTPDGAMIETVVGHKSGGERSLGKLFIPASKKDAHGFGSALSYARRYALMAAFGIPAEDDDGNAASLGRGKGQSQQGAVSPRPDTSPHTGEPTGRAQGWREPTSTLSTPSKLAAEMRRLERELAGCGDSDMVYGLTASDEWREFARVALKHAPHYLRGGDPAPPEFEGLANTAERLVREFEATKEAA